MELKMGTEPRRLCVCAWCVSSGRARHSWGALTLPETSNNPVEGLRLAVVEMKAWLGPSPHPQRRLGPSEGLAGSYLSTPYLNSSAPAPGAALPCTPTSPTPSPAQGPAQTN